MALTFTEADLLPDISQKELDGIGKTLVNGGDPQPIATTITEQIQKVEDYTQKWELPDDWKKRLVRALVLYELYARLQSIPEKRKDKYQEAMKELRDIRDGKFSHLVAVADPAPAGLPGASGSWGSSTKII